MILIIPLGDIGDSFKRNGYNLPKGLVKVFGKPILYYLLDYVSTCKNIDFVYIPYHREYAKYRFEGLLRKDYPTITFQFLYLIENTRGVVETLHIALQNLTCPDNSIVSFDGDNFYTTDVLTGWANDNRIMAFEDLHNDPLYSYLRIIDKNITGIVEKQKISNYACTGVYGFASYKQLMKYAERLLVRGNGEYYVSNIIQAMLQDGIKFQYSIIDKKQWHCLGDPVQVQQFCANFQGDLQLKTMRICFDLDNTLVTFPTVKDDYSTVEPILQNIRFLQNLKQAGHTIIIHTARRMKTHNGNNGRILRDIGKLTFDTLEKFQIPYDELYFGKPHADVYIDDLGLNCFDNMEKALGVYMNEVSPRDFNQLAKNSLDTFTKQSTDLFGEIYYYENIPKQIKDLFPVFIESDELGTWYTMEKINGLTCTSMYLSELLTCDHLVYIMKSLQRIHGVPYNGTVALPIYSNYCEKLRSRYNGYDYSQFPGSAELYFTLLTKLQQYEDNDAGKLSCIHGDAVFSNIIINTSGKIKFIDMRGELGKIQTIYGDWLYDWAKLYQSLIGYDKIMQGKLTSPAYEKKMRECFEMYFLQCYTMADLENLKVLTKSLLFTLIPLHNNAKCLEYFNLIATIDS